MNYQAILRISTFLLGILLLAASIGEMIPARIYGIPAGLAIFLGVTNFGRQCPLILSIHHLYYRMKKTKKEHSDGNSQPDRP
jgi:hypothetical protein